MPGVPAFLQDLAEVSSKFAVSSIQLRFTFMRGLHPFSPPRLEVVRPHLSTPLPGALSSYPLLRLENWHPTLTMTQLVDNIRTFLEVSSGGCHVDGLGTPTLMRVADCVRHGVHWLSSTSCGAQWRPCVGCLQQAQEVSCIS
jgi:hypothetical protein